jgi:hypothetical protein
VPTEGASARAPALQELLEARTEVKLGDYPRGLTEPQGDVRHRLHLWIKVLAVTASVGLLFRALTFT